MHLSEDGHLSRSRSDLERAHGMRVWVRRSAQEGRSISAMASELQLMAGLEGQESGVSAEF